MILAPSGFSAQFKYEANGQERRQNERVVAFDDSGEPLIAAGGTYRRLERASSVRGYVCLVEESQEITALIPGGGWRAEYTHPDGSKYDTPLVAWAIRNGGVIPLETDDHGFISDAGEHTPPDINFRIYHPDITETPAPIKE